MRLLSRGSILTAVLALSIAGCNDSELERGAAGTGYASDDDDDDSPPNGDPDDTDPGLDGGHFDLDTSSAFYPFDQGTTDHHVHEYDDRYDVTADPRSNSSSSSETPGSRRWCGSRQTASPRT